MEFAEENQEMQMETESPSPSHVTNQVESNGDVKILNNNGQGCYLVQADHMPIHIQNVYIICSRRKLHTYIQVHRKLKGKKSQRNHKNITAAGKNVARPLQSVSRVNTQKQKTCRKLLDRLTQLSAKGELKKCKNSIDRLFKSTRDPDCCAALWTAAAVNYINGGKMASAHEALQRVTMLLSQTENRAEHELRRDHYKSLIYLREEKCDQLFQGVGLTTVALQTTELVQVGCLRAWLWINHGWFHIKMANLQQGGYKQAALIKVAEESFLRATDDSCHEEEEFPGQLQDKRTRIRQCALIGRVYLRLRCWRLVSVGENDTKQGITDGVPEENIQEAQKILDLLEDREHLCGICEVLYHLAKAHLCYRFKQYPEALKEAEAARDLAIHGDFKNYIDIAEGIVKLFRQAVTRTCTCGWHLLPA